MFGSRAYLLTKNGERQSISKQNGSSEMRMKCCGLRRNTLLQRYRQMKNALPMSYQQGREFFAYIESFNQPKVKYFITDRKIIIELGYELLGYTFGFCPRSENSAGERGADRGIGCNAAVSTCGIVRCFRRENIWLMRLFVTI